MTGEAGASVAGTTAPSATPRAGRGQAARPAPGLSPHCPEITRQVQVCRRPLVAVSHFVYDARSSVKSRTLMLL